MKNDQKEVADYCLDARNKGKTWKEIAKEISALGFVTSRGKQYTIANLNIMATRIHPSLRCYTMSKRKERGQPVGDIAHLVLKILHSDLKRKAEIAAMILEG